MWSYSPENLVGMRRFRAHYEDGITKVYSLHAHEEWDKTGYKKARCVHLDRPAETFMDLFRIPVAFPPNIAIRYSSTLEASVDIPAYKEIMNNHQEVPDENCSCGLYASWACVNKLDTILTSSLRTPLAIVEAHGKTIMCDKGFRAEGMQVVAALGETLSDYFEVPIISEEEALELVAQQLKKVRYA